MSVKWSDNADDVVGKLFNDNDLEIDYVVFTLEGKTNMVLHEGHSGKGGRAKVEEILSDNTDDKVMTGAFLASAVDERGGVTSTRRKYIHFLWVGPSVGVMVKGRVNSFSGEFRDKFPGCVVYLQLMGDLDQLEEKHLEKELLACGGAHKPSRYSFSNTGLAKAFASSPIGKAMAEASVSVQQGVEKVQHVVSDLVHSSHHVKKETTIPEDTKAEETEAEFAEDAAPQKDEVQVEVKKDEEVTHEPEDKTANEAAKSEGTPADEVPMEEKENDPEPKPEATEEETPKEEEDIAKTPAVETPEAPKAEES